MRLPEALVPIVAALVSLSMAPIAGPSIDTITEGASTAARIDRAVRSRLAQGRSTGGPQNTPSDAEIRQAVGSIERAGSYREVLEATERYEDIISSARMVELIDGRLQDRGLDENQRGLLILERQLSLDCRLRGAAAAARLLSVRLIAGSALLADSPQQVASVLEKFSELASGMSAQLVREALGTPGSNWPEGLIPLMEQLGRDWPQYGALAAAVRMAEAANLSTATTTGPGSGPTLTGHWSSTTITFERPRDEHLVLRADGTAETWTVTASDRTGATRGRWSSQGTTLNVDWEDGRQWSQPFTFHEGQLVFPNITARRQFWDPIR